MILVSHPMTMRVTVEVAVVPMIALVYQLLLQALLEAREATLASQTAVAAVTTQMPSPTGRTTGVDRSEAQEVLQN
jgi:hypothetical protein